MGNFVTGNPALPALKTNAYPPQASTSELDAADINNLWSAAGDLRTHVQGWLSVNEYADIQTTITAAGTAQAVFIPTSYAGSDSYTNPNGIPIFDFRAATVLSSGAALTLMGNVGSGATALALDNVTALTSGKILSLRSAGVEKSYFAFDGRIAAPNIGKGGDCVSVKDWGAKGDGVTDDTAAFNNALADTAHQVYVPAGTYVISGSGISIPIFKSLIGAGNWSAILSYSGTGACITLNSVQGCVVSGLRIFCTSSASTVRGILVTVSSATTNEWNTIQNCTIVASNGQTAGQIGLLLDNSSSTTGIYWNSFRDLHFGQWETSVKLLGGASNQPNQNHFNKIMSYAAVTGLFISRGNDNTIHGLYGSASGYTSAQTLLVIGDGSTTSAGNLCFGVVSDQGANGKCFAIALGAINNVIWADNESSVASTNANTAATDTNALFEMKPSGQPSFKIGNVTYGSASIAASPTPTTSPFLIRGAVADGASSIAIRLTNNGAFANATAKLVQVTNGATEKLAIDLNGKSVYPTGSGADVVGKSILVAGTVTVSTTAVTAASIILLTRQVTGGTTGDLRVGTVTAGTSFVINSASGTDTSTVSWMIVN